LSLNVDPEATDPLVTLPGELLVGAIGSVFTWLVAEQLVKEGTQARELASHVTLTISGEADNATDAILNRITCQMSGRVAGVQETHLQLVAQAAMTQCIKKLGMRTEGIGRHCRGFAGGQLAKGAFPGGLYKAPANEHLYGDGGNRTRVRDRVGMASTSVAGALISSSTCLAGGVVGDQPS
jgi:hypothetical protein